MNKLAVRLNELHAIPNVCKGVVTLTTEDAKGNEKELKLKGKGYVDEHPEGSDRGGYVPYWEQGSAFAYFYEPEGEWYGYGDDEGDEDDEDGNGFGE